MRDVVATRGGEVLPSAVSQMMAKARQLEANGARLTYLMRGEPDFQTPAHISQAANEALQAGETHYSPVQGIPRLRQAVARRMQRDFGLLVDPNEVLITTGATMGIHLAIQAVVNPGDQVLMFNPVYDPYASVVRLAGGIPVLLPAQEANGHFSVPIRAIEEQLTERTKAIMINNPWNPTGTVMSAEELRSLVELAEGHDLVLIADEIYEKIVFDGHTHHSLAALALQARERIITVNSFSKTYAMTGWRMGYNIAPPHLTRAMVLIAEQLSRSAATFIQLAGVAALEGPQDAVEAMVKTYAGRRQLISDRLRGAGLKSFQPPEGTFFIFLDIRAFGKTSQELADYLLTQGNVVTIPGSVYGSAGEGYLRLSFAYHEDTLCRGIETMIEALGRL